jgi:succinate dehydrogenase/fumarate reductase flavoprotein subunit
METEIVIVGFGGAGACAAIEAVDAGSSVIILEKNPEDAHYNNTLMSGGLFHCPDKAADPNELKEYLTAMFSGENLPSKTEGESSPLYIKDIVDKFAEWSYDVCDFLKGLDPDIMFVSPGGPAFPDFPGAEKGGYRTFNTAYTETPDLYPTLDRPKMETGRGLALWNCLMIGIKDRIDNINIQWETPGKSLITNDAGEVIGVVATQAGKDLRIKATKAVLLTTGGYEYNEEMRRAFLEGPGVTGWAFVGTTSNEGDGIAMACAAGAQLAKVGKSAARLIFSCPDATHNGMPIGVQTGGVGTPGTIMVNATGKRFMNESLITSDPSRYFAYKEAVHMDIISLTYPNIPSYMIYDETRRGSGPLVSLDMGSAAFGLFEWDEDNQIAVDRGWVLKGDTLEELAEKIKNHPENSQRFDKDNFLATMARYQEMVETGVDADYSRAAGKGFVPINTPPFYAMPLVCGGPNTKGGVQTDAERHVVDWKNQIIPRLYSSGEMSSCFKFVYQGGGNITECLTFGRLAGKNAAAETPWQ